MTENYRPYFGNEEDIEALEERLLRLSNNYLDYKKRCYNDDPVNVLKNLYCLKEHPEKEAVAEEGTSGGSWISKLLSRVPALEGEGKLYLGIDGNTYRESELQLWSQAHPLLLVLRKKIKEDEFDPNW